MASPPRRSALALAVALAALAASTRAKAQSPTTPLLREDDAPLRRRPPSPNELPPPTGVDDRGGTPRGVEGGAYEEGGSLRQRERFEPSPETVRKPRIALWAGGRLGGELPVADGFKDYGDEFTQAQRFGERQLVGPGASIEIDVGARLGRRFLPFIFAQRLFATAGSASKTPRPKPPPLSPPDEGAVPPEAASPSVDSSSAFALGLGFRYEFNPDARLGPAVEIAYAFRQTNVSFNTRQALSAESSNELRIGVGATFRATEALTLSPLVTFAFGSYNDVTLEGFDGRERFVASEAPLHGYLGLSLGAHVDLFGKR